MGFILTFIWEAQMSVIQKPIFMLLALRKVVIEEWLAVSSAWLGPLQVTQPITTFLSWHVIRKAIWYVSNFRNITYYLFWFFFNLQNWDSQQGRDSCLKIFCNISKIRKFVTYQIAFLMTCQRQKFKIMSQFYCQFLSYSFPL